MVVAVIVFVADTARVVLAESELDPPTCATAVLSTSLMATAASTLELPEPLELAVAVP
jgi:hypothetical protein